MELQETNQEEFRIEKLIKKKEDMSNYKAMIIQLIAGLIRKISHRMSQYFPKPYELLGGNINVKVDLSNYATKAGFKKATGIDASNLALKSNLATLKAEIDKNRCRQIKECCFKQAKQCSK